MADLNAAQVNTFTAADAKIGAAIFENDAGTVKLNLNALTGDALNGADLTSVPLAETLIKLADVLNRTARSVATATPTQDAQQTYPALQVTARSKSDGTLVNQVTARIIGEQPMSYDSVVAL